jgi:hypothetical protein
MSATRLVDLRVPFVRHSSPPLERSFASKKMAPSKRVNHDGCEFALPGLMFFTNLGSETACAALGAKRRATSAPKVKDRLIVNPFRVC